MANSANRVQYSNLNNNKKKIIIIINCFHQAISSFTNTFTTTITYLTVGEHYWADGPFSNVSFSLSG